MRNVYVVGIGMTRFAKQPDRTLKELTGEAVTAALKDAGVTVHDVHAAYFGNAVGGSITGQEMLAGQFTLLPLGLGFLGMRVVDSVAQRRSSIAPA